MSENNSQPGDETSSVSLDKLAETSSVAVTKVDRKGKIVYANDKAEKVLGLQKSEITDRTYDDPDWNITYYDGTDYPSDELPFEIVKETEEPVQNVRYAIERPDGKRRLLSVNASPLFDDEGDFDGMVEVIEDVTERQPEEEEEELRKKEERLRLALQGAISERGTGISRTTELSSMSAGPR